MMVWILQIEKQKKKKKGKTKKNKWKRGLLDEIGRKIFLREKLKGEKWEGGWCKRALKRKLKRVIKEVLERSEGEKNRRKEERIELE